MSAANKNALFNFIHNKKAADLATGSKALLTLTADDIVEKAVKVMADNKILSVPVLNKDELVGIVDVCDIAAFVASVKPSKNEQKQDPKSALERAGRTMALTHVKSVLDASQHDPMMEIFEDSTASMCVELFAKGIHRAVLANKDGKLTGLVSQSDVARALQPEIRKGKLKDIGALSLHDLGYDSAKVVTVKDSSSVGAALAKMQKHGVSALAVVGASGKLVGNFSASDLRGLYYAKFPALVAPIKEYLQKNSPSSLQPQCGQPKTSLADIVDELVNNKLHHLWVVDDDFMPSGIISLTDIMKIIYDAPAASVAKELQNP